MGEVLQSLKLTLWPVSSIVDVGFDRQMAAFTKNHQVSPLLTTTVRIREVVDLDVFGAGAVLALLSTAPYL